MTGLSSLLSINSVTLVGTGLLGGSLGLALRQSGFTGAIIGTGSRPASLQSALDKGCITQIQTDVAQAVANTGLIVLAGPINTFHVTFKTIAAHAHLKTVITDVGSTKASVAS